MATYDPNNIFAKILRGEIPSHRVYEDADVVAFMDVMPQGTGHTLVVPKAGSRNLLDADPARLAALMQAVQKVARAVKAAFAADGVTIVQYNEPAAGQSGGRKLRRAASGPSPRPAVPWQEAHNWANSRCVRSGGAAAPGAGRHAATCPRRAGMVSWPSDAR